MQWQLFSQEEYAKLPTNHCLPPPQTPATVAFALQEEIGKNSTKILALTRSPEKEQKAFPVALLSWQNLQNACYWQKIWQIYPLCVADIAYYTQSKLIKEKKEIDSNIIMQSCGWATHFQNVKRWQELGKLSAMSRKLACQYDFNLRILRLWDRFHKTEQLYWLEIWGKYRFSKNIIQDIICYYYELTYQKRQVAQEKIEKNYHRLADKKREKTKYYFPRRKYTQYDL